MRDAIPPLPHIWTGRISCFWTFILLKCHWRGQYDELYRCLSPTNFCTSVFLKGSVVSIVTNLWARKSKVWILAETRDFSLLWDFQPCSGAHTATYWMGNRVNSLVGGGMTLNTEVRNKRGYTSTPPLHLQGMDRKNFTIIFAINCILCLIPKDFRVLLKCLWLCQPLY